MVIFGVHYGYVMLYDLVESNHSGLDVFLGELDYGLN